MALSLDEALGMSLADEADESIHVDVNTRQITIPESQKLFGVESDADVEVKHIVIDGRYADGNRDLSKLAWRVIYRNANKDTSYYLIPSVVANENSIEMDWLIKRSVVAYKGTVDFILCAFATTSSGEVTPEWNSTLGQGIVLEGLETSAIDIGKESVDELSKILYETTTARDAAAKSAADADRTANSIKDSMAQISENKEAVSQLKEDLYDLVLKTKRNPLQLFNVNNVTDGKLKNDGTVDVNNSNYVTNKYEDISDFVGYYFASIGNDTPCAFYDEGYKLVQYFADSRYYRNQIVPANSKYFKVSTVKSVANTFCFSVSNNKFNTVPTYNDYIVEKTELNPIVLVPTKQDKNVGADNKGKILMVGDDGNIVYKDYLEKESKIIEYWGDSLTEGNQDNSGVTRATVLSSLVGSEWTVINNNDGGGEKSNTISCKACGTGIIAEPFTIPSSTDKVEVVLKDDIGYDCNFRRSSNMAESTLNPCIVNGITGIISPGPVFGQNPYKFQRNESGNEVVLKRPTGVISSSAKKQKGSVLIICIGQNTGWNNDGSLLVKQVKGIIEYYKSTRFLVIGIPHSKVHDWQIAGNDALKLEFGRHYIDVEEYMKTPIYDADGTTIISSYALDDCNLTPTSEDIVNIGQNKYPTQIMSDSTHFNRYGYTIWANLEYQRGKELGYWN